MRVRPAIAIIEDGKILMLRYNYSGKDLFQFPGGNMEDAEELEKTLKRELMEELNLSVSISKLILVAQVIQENKQQATLHCLFTGTILDNLKPIINPIETSAIEAVWVDVSVLDKINLYPSVGVKLKYLLENDVLNSTTYLGKIEQPWL